MRQFGKQINKQEQKKTIIQTDKQKNKQLNNWTIREVGKTEKQRSR